MKYTVLPSKSAPRTRAIPAFYLTAPILGHESRTGRRTNSAQTAQRQAVEASRRWGHAYLHDSNHSPRLVAVFKRGQPVWCEEGYPFAPAD